MNRNCLTDICMTMELNLGRSLHFCWYFSYNGFVSLYFRSDDNRRRKKETDRLDYVAIKGNCFFSNLKQSCFDHNGTAHCNNLIEHFDNQRKYRNSPSS